MINSISLFITPFFLSLMFLSLQGCQFDESKVEIERFEFLDGYSGEAFDDERYKHLNNQQLSKAYVVHGYKKRYDIEINQIIDRYLCDSILPDLHFERSFDISFFKASKNTNREKFEERLSERRMVHARSYDKLLHFRLFHPNDSTLWIAKQKAGLMKPDPPEEKVYCQ